VILIRAIAAVIHACLKAMAAVALAMGSIFLTSVALVIGGVLLVGALSAGGAGGVGIARWRRRGRSDTEEKL
jgi:hypothetical protein